MKILLRILLAIYQICIMAPVMLVATFLCASVTIIGCMLGGGRWWGYYPEVAWSRIMCWVSLVRVTVRREAELDKGQSYVFVCNHQGAYDIFAVYGWLGHNFRWLMKASLRRMPMVGYACYRARQVFVDNSSPSAIRRTMEAAESNLAKGMSIVVFPEGARTWDGRMRRFKRGAYALAMEFGLPVVPVTIDGSFAVLPRFRKVPRPGHIRLTVHAPIYPGPEGYDLPQLMADTAAVIAGSLPE